VAIGAALVDRARTVRREATGQRVEGTSLMAPVFGEWFRARLFLDMQQYAERDEQGERRKVVHTPQLMFGVRDVVGGAVAVLAEEEVEVDSPEFGRQVWRVTGDPQPIRKKRAVIGGLVTLERVVERGRAGVT
jgi:hypothetical protein